MPVLLPSAPLRGCFLQTGPYLALIGLALLWGPQLCQATTASLRLRFQLWPRCPLVFSPELSIPSAHPFATLPRALLVPTFTCLPSRGLPDKKLQNLNPHLLFKTGISAHLVYKINSDAQSVNMYGARLRIRAFVDIDRSAKQFVLANVTMIYHYHIFVGKSIKSMGLPVEQD